MLYLAYGLLFFAIPLGVLAFFVVSLVRYITGRQQEKTSPRCLPPMALQGRRTMLIVSSVMLGILLAVVAGLVILLYLAIAYM